MKEIHSFNIKIHPLRKIDFIQIIDERIKGNTQLIQSGVNAASIVELKHSADIINAYNNADLINIDGMSMVWALRYLGFEVPERVACPDLAMAIMELAEKNKYSLFLFGAKEANLTAAVENIRIMHPQLHVSGFRNGYYQPEDEESVIQMINSANSDILFLGMPSPQKEFFVEKYRNQLKVKYILGVGGFFDILSGSIKRAPLWMQNSGMEWFYRLIKEPRRMWRRYLIGNLTFIKLVIQEKNRSKK
jgi:N-acetylglucosaminyldiphosphoundecaprenol N-acetyl-beta-D-mannosaminyltransferase